MDIIHGVLFMDHTHMYTFLSRYIYEKHMFLYIRINGMNMNFARADLGMSISDEISRRKICMQQLSHLKQQKR